MTLNVVLDFLKEIEIRYTFQEIAQDGFLPGLELANGGIVIDLKKLAHVGDVLHEAGHLACMPPRIRGTLSGVLPNTDITNGGEMMAMAWSFAACKYLGLDASVVFHEHGYKGEAQRLIAAYESGTGPGIALLQWLGMCYDEVGAIKSNLQPFPYMHQWLCTVDKYQI